MSGMSSGLGKTRGELLLNLKKKLPNTSSFIVIVPDTILSPLHMLPHLTFIAASEVRYAIIPVLEMRKWAQRG